MPAISALLLDFIAFTYKIYIQMRVEKKTKYLPIDSIGHSHNSVICSGNAKMDNSVTLIDKVFVFPSS